MFILSHFSNTFALSGGGVHDQNVLMGMHPPTSEGYIMSHNTQSTYDQHHHSPIHQQNHSPGHQQQNMSPTYNTMDNTQSHLPSLNGEMKISEHHHSL